MPDQEIIRKQRDLLRVLRQYANTRTRAEANAESERSSESDTAEVLLSEVRDAAAGQLARALHAQQTAHNRLEAVGLDSVQHPVHAPPLATMSSRDPARELAARVAVADEALQGVNTATTALEDSRKHQKKTWFRQQVMILVLVLLLGGSIYCLCALSLSQH